jgi:hypothetical protein
VLGSRFEVAFPDVAIALDLLGNAGDLQGCGMIAGVQRL